jgi:hypothetical protein
MPNIAIELMYGVGALLDILRSQLPDQAGKIARLTVGVLQFAPIYSVEIFQHRCSVTAAVGEPRSSLFYEVRSRI